MSRKKNRRITCRHTVAEIVKDGFRQHLRHRHGLDVDKLEARLVGGCVAIHMRHGERGCALSLITHRTGVLGHTIEVRGLKTCGLAERLQLLIAEDLMAGMV